MTNLYYGYSQDKLENALIQTSSIQDTDIDMNNKKITSVATPTNPGDAVPLGYITGTIGINTGSVILSGTTPVLIQNSSYGSFYIMINGGINAPNGVFAVSKNQPTFTNGQINTLASSRGDTTNERLKITWAANGGIFLEKTGSSYDGTYYYKIL
jgi:hypothetical protein